MTMPAGEACLKDASGEGAIRILPGGVKYRVLKAGNGKTPGRADSVLCHFRGILLTSSLGNTHRLGPPTALKIPDVIPGLRDALLNMPVGSRWQLFIPPELAYGKKRSHSRIRTLTTIQIELELLAIE